MSASSYVKVSTRSSIYTAIRHTPLWATSSCTAPFVSRSTAKSTSLRSLFKYTGRLTVPFFILTASFFVQLNWELLSGTDCPSFKARRPSVHEAPESCNPDHQPGRRIGGLSHSPSTTKDSSPDASSTSRLSTSCSKDHPWVCATA